MRFVGVVVLAALWSVSAHTTVGQTQSPTPLPARPGQVAPAQRPNTVELKPTGVIRGRITAAETAIPIRAAQVRLLASAAAARGGPPPEPRNTVTDEAGQYRFNELPAGRYTLTVTKNGYVPSGYGMRPPTQRTPQPVELSAAQTLDGIDIVLSRGGVAVVTVTDPDGEPLAGVDVNVLQLRMVNGERTLGAAGPSNETNDLGRARLFGLAPGEYYVSAQPALGAANRALPLTYYPGTLTGEDAQRIQIVAGQETSVTFPLLTAKLARLSGVIRTSNGQGFRVPTGVSPGLSTPLSLRQFVLGGTYVRTIPINGDGSFDIKDLAPGRYDLVVNPGNPLQRAGVVNETREFARMPITIAEADITGLVVTTTPGATLSGKVTFDSGPVPDGLTPEMARVFLVSTDQLGSITSGDAVMSNDFSFVLEGVSAKGILRLPTTSRWFTKSVVIDGKDVTNTPIAFDGGRTFKGIEIVATQKRATLVAQVDSQGRVSTDYAVILFPADRTLWYPRSPVVFASRADQAGTVRITAVPEGRYLAVAVDRLEPNEQQDAELLARLSPRASTVSVRDGETTTVSLRLQVR